MVQCWQLIRIKTHLGTITAYNTCKQPSVDGSSSPPARVQTAKPVKKARTHTQKGDNMQFDLMTIFVLSALIFTMFSAFATMFFTVEQRTTAIVQRLGKFLREAGPGIQIKIPFVDSVAARSSIPRCCEKIFAKSVVSSGYTP